MVLKDSLNKNKSLDPFITSLLRIIREKRSRLNNLESINIQSEFLNIVSERDGDNFYIENEFHKAKGFRKLHIEIAEFSGSLKILHCVFFPDPEYNIPIFGLDIVKINNAVSAAIVDLSPVSNNCNKQYNKLMESIYQNDFVVKRNVPDWGEIFSKYLIFVSLKDSKEQNNFNQIVEKYLNVLVKISNNAEKDHNQKSIEEREFFQKKYCVQQMKNEKTKLVLMKYFEKNWVEDYIKDVLFDF